MTVTDSTMIYVSLLVINYLLIWRHTNKNGDPYIGHLLGDLGFIIIGFAALLITGITVPWAWLISILAGIHLLLTISET